MYVFMLRSPGNDSNIQLSQYSLKCYCGAHVWEHKHVFDLKPNELTHF